MFKRLRQKNTTQEKVTALIAAAGEGRRMGADVPKQFLMLGDKPVLAHTLKRFEECDAVDEIVVVTRGEDILLVNDLVREFNITKVTAILPGGDTRQESVFLGLESVADGGIVLIHDGARPFVTDEQIIALTERAAQCGAAAPGTAITDTVKRTDADGFITETVSRERLYRIQTPQAFKADKIKAAHRSARKEGVSVTDDCALFEMYGGRVAVTDGSSLNIKITTPEDLMLAEIITENME